MAEITNALAFRGTNTVFEGVKANLERLPVELLDHILSHIGWADNDDHELRWCDRVWNLSRLSKTSKRLRAATEPALYAEFMIPLSDKALMKLLWTVTTRPSLGRHIKSLCMDLNECCVRKSPTSEQMALFGPALDVFRTMSWYWSLLQALAKGCYNADLMILLRLATGLQRLTYTYYHERTIWNESCQRCPSSGLFLADLLSASRSSQDGLGHLRTVTLQARQSYSGMYKESEMPFETLRLFSKLPLLSELRCCALIIRDQGMNGTHQKQLSNLQSIVLQRTSIDSASLATLMGCCKSLKRLDVDTATFRIDANKQRQTIDFGSTEMTLALERHIDTLEYCALTNCQNLARNWAGKEEVSRMSALKPFLILRDLTVDEDNLLGLCMDKYDGKTHPPGPFADQMRMWEAIDLNSILPQGLSRLRIHSWSHFSLLKGILTGMSKYGCSALKHLEVIFPCALDSNMEYQRSVESYKPYKDGTQPWLLDMVNREVSVYGIKNCIRFCIIGPSLASRLHALVQTMPDEGLLPPQQPVESESESEFESESDPEPDHSGEDDGFSEDEWPDEIAESSDDDSEHDMDSNDEASDSEDSGLSTDDEDSDD